MSAAGNPEYVTARIKEALAHDPGIGELEIDVEVHGREVRLSGTLPTPDRRDAVLEVVRDLCPDHTVVDDLEVGPFPERTGHEPVQ